VLERAPELLPAGSTVLVAVSGGCDSMALLHLLADLAPARALDLRAGHFDHALRAESAAEADRVRTWCEDLGVPCAVGRASDPGTHQAAYRAARYGFLSGEAHRTDASRVALAHQRDDQLETLLHRLMRGTALRGLRGIPARRGPYVRPLLGFRRSELRVELERRGIAWLRDPSNDDPHYARARIRHRLIPRLEAVAIAGSLADRTTRLAIDAARADRGLDARASDALASAGVAGRDSGGGAQIARSRLAAYHRAEQARMLRILARNQGFELSRGGTRSGVEFIKRGVSGGGVDLADGLRLTREYDRLLLGPPAAAPADRELSIEDAGPGEGAAELGGRVVLVRWGAARSAPRETSSPWSVDLPVAGLAFPLRLRGPRPGDRIRTGAGTRKLKKLWNERRVPRSRRAQVPVLAAADGTVVWVVGHAVAVLETADRQRERFWIGVGEH